MATSHGTAQNENLPTYKFILLGEANAGKTSLFYYFRDGRFIPSERYGPGADYCSRIISIGNDKIKITVWDTAGVERYRTLTRNYFRGTCAAIMAYNTSDMESLQHLVSFIEDVNENAPNALRYLVGCKCDLPEDSRISERTIHNFAQAHGCNKTFMTSAKSGIGVDEAITAIAQEVHEHHKEKRCTSKECHGDGTHGAGAGAGAGTLHGGFYSTTHNEETNSECGCSQ